MEGLKPSFSDYKNLGNPDIFPGVVATWNLGFQDRKLINWYMSDCAIRAYFEAICSTLILHCAAAMNNGGVHDITYLYHKYSGKLQYSKLLPNQMGSGHCGPHSRIFTFAIRLCKETWVLLFKTQVWTKSSGFMNPVGTQVLILCPRLLCVGAWMAVEPSISSLKVRHFNLLLLLSPRHRDNWLTCMLLIR